MPKYIVFIPDSIVGTPDFCVGCDQPKPAEPCIVEYVGGAVAKVPFHFCAKCQQIVANGESPSDIRRLTPVEPREPLDRTALAIAEAADWAHLVGEAA